MTLPAIPTALSALEAAELHRLADGKNVLEAGALLGFSTVVMAKTAARVISIDRHEGYGPPTWSLFLRNLHHFRVTGNVTPIVGDALEHLPRLSADVAFLDLTGGYDLTLAAIRACRTPLIAVHDFNRSNCPGVERAVRDSGRPLLYAVDTLAVLGLTSGAHECEPSTPQGFLALAIRFTSAWTRKSCAPSCFASIPRI